MKKRKKYFKGFLTTAVTASLVTTMFGSVTTAASFEDVGSKYKESVDFLVSKGIKGLSSTEFGVYKEIKRVDAAVMLATVLELDIENAPASGFIDIPQRAVKHVNALKAAGITQGKTAKTFDSNSPITRGELAIWFHKAFELKGTSDLKFTDVNKRYEIAVKALVANGITNGISPTLFGTNQHAKRGDFAKLLKSSYDSSTISKTLTITNVKSITNTTIEIKLSKEVESVKAENFSIQGAKVTAATLAADKKTVILVSSGLEYEKSYTLKVSGLSINGGKHKDLTYAFKTAGVQDLWDLSVKTKASTLNANGTDQTEVIVHFISKSTGQVDKNADNILLELTTTHGSITPKTVTMQKGEAKVVLKSSSSSNDVTAKISAKITKAPEAYKAILGKVTGNTSIVFKGVPKSGSPGGGGNPTLPGSEKFTLSLMHTNDTHANLDNVAKRVTAVKEVRAKKPDSLLLDAGDVFSGTLYFNEFKGQADLQFMNLMKYDLMTMGNHEFDLGSSPEGHKALAEFVKKSKFSFVSTNVNYSKDTYLKKLFSNEITSKPKSGNIYNGVIKTINGEKVGFFGLTTEETKDISSPVNITFSNYIDEANKTVKAFEKLGVNKIVAITHIGYDDNPAYDNDLTLAKEVDGIDVIVGGHSHTQLDEPVVVNTDEKGEAKDPTVIVQAYQYNEYLGTLDVEFDKKGKIVGHAGELIKIADKTADPEAEALLKPYKDKIAEIKNTPTEGVAAKALTSPRDGGDVTKPSVRKNETELGNLITDGMLDKAKEFNPKTVMAFQNGGGIRADINEGPITLGEILTVLPFGNTLATMELTGAEIKEALEHSVRVAPAESGGFLHVSGMKFTYDSTKPAGDRVQTMEVKNADGSYSSILLEQKYVIATNAFTAKGGDGFTVFQKAYNEGRVTDIGLADWENLRDYVNKLKDVNPQIEGRIKDTASKTVDASEFSGTADAPKTYTGNVRVDVSSITALEHAIIKGDLKLTGTETDAFSFSNLKIEGDFDISEINGSIFNFSGIEVGGETIF